MRIKKLGRGMLLSITTGMMLLITAQTLQAQDRHREDRRERMERLRNLHERCDNGHKRACIRFGMELCEARARREEWRREHPEWYNWDRDRF